MTDCTDIWPTAGLHGYQCSYRLVLITLHVTADNPQEEIKKRWLPDVSVNISIGIMVSYLLGIVGMHVATQYKGQHKILMA